jgi:23S rRNA (cytidine1920-2'-O)/16S rRNA (cytidine1409-2'-O)-methyltransferase
LKAEELYKGKGLGVKGKGMGEQKASLAVIDVSFISLGIIFPAVHNLLSDEGEIVALVKPQFEAGREQVGKGGIVKDPIVQAEVLNNVIASAGKIGLKLLGATHSPISGADGNIEFLVHLGKTGEAIKIDAGKIVGEAHTKLTPRTPSLSPCPQCEHMRGRRAPC